MIDVTIGGVVYTLPKYELVLMRRAAPYYDRLAAVADRQDIGDLSKVIEQQTQALGFIWCGIAETHPEITLADLEKVVTPSELVQATLAVPQILKENGMFDAAGEAKAALQSGTQTAQTDAPLESLPTS